MSLLPIMPPPPAQPLVDRGLTDVVWYQWFQRIARLEAVHYVGSTGEPAFEDSWANYSATEVAAGFYKDRDHRVYLSGVVKSGDVGATKAVFTLPADYRPLLNEIFPVVSNGAFGYCQVDTDGAVRPVSGNNASFSLCGISFRAEQ